MTAEPRTFSRAIFSFLPDFFFSPRCVAGAKRWYESVQLQVGRRETKTRQDAKTETKAQWKTKTTDVWQRDEKANLQLEAESLESLDGVKKTKFSRCWLSIGFNYFENRAPTNWFVLYNLILNHFLALPQGKSKFHIAWNCVRCLT